jgi:Holliday junction resolvasome RuvABC endonuclease subunit
MDMSLTVKQKRAQMERTIRWLGKKLPRSEPTVAIGIDLSYTATGYCVYTDEGVVEMGTFGTQSDFGTDRERNRYLYDQFVELFEEFKPSVVAMEAITVWKNPAATHKLIYCESAMYHAMVDCGIDVLFKLITNQIKKIATGEIKASKSQVLKGVLLNHGVDAADDNQADAFCAALAAYSVREVVHQFETEADKWDDHDKFLLEFDKKRLHESFSGDVALYETVVGMLASESGEVLKTNDKAAYYDARELVGDLAPEED